MPPLKLVIQRARGRVYACAFVSGLSLACIAVLLSRQYAGQSVPTHRLLLIASTGFVLAGLIAGALRTIYGRLMVSGLILCWLGDYLGPGHFEWSVLAFALAHLLFLAAFTLRGVERSYLIIAGIGFVFMTVRLGFWIVPHVPADFLVPIIAYMVIITAMASVACGQRSGPGRFIIFIGAVLFYVSDIFVARWAFVVPEASNAYFCYPMYYSACLLLAFSILLYDAPDDDGE